jgi:hypothetical protein
MERPEDIPEWAWELTGKAEAAASAYGTRRARYARALIATETRVREECAQVADRISWSNKWTGSLGPEQNSARVATEIRKGTPS